VTGEIDRIWGEVRRLPRRQVQVIALAHIDGLNQVEIADTLGISKESVNTHLRRARQTLARALNIEETE
jgi:RNA polymerase sigma factor (sigma-70 family)